MKQSEGFRDGKTFRSTMLNQTIYPDGTRLWWISMGNPLARVLHNPDGPAIIRGNGSSEWWLNGERHRLDGPAVESIDGIREWWVNGQRHREDGPAYVHPEDENEWWFRGEYIPVSTQYDFADRLPLLRVQDVHDL